MAISTHPRSAADATRFTATTPHAARKSEKSSAGASSSSSPSSPASASTSSSTSSASSSSSRFVPPSAGAGAGAGGGGGGRGRVPPPPPLPRGAGPLTETPEQRVARLRAAHLAAKNAEISRFDRVVDASRRVFDSAHRMTIAGLIGFTAIAGLLTVYTAVDMLRHNRKRKAEFIEAQKRMEAGSLEEARLAYMRGDATEEQIALVEEARARAARGEIKLPSLLGAPAPIPAGAAAATGTATATPSVSQAATWPSTATAGTAPAADDNDEEDDDEEGGAKSKSWFRRWFFSNLKREEEGEDPGTSERRLGYESLSEEDEAVGVRESDIVRAVEERQAYLRAKAQAAAAAAPFGDAVERERANQRNGGPLDRIGLEAGAKATAKEGGEAAPGRDEKKQKSWWRWW